MREIYKNANCYLDESRTFSRVDILVESGKIIEIAKSIVAKEGDIVYNLEGMNILPGLVDVHVHMREPGFSHKETIKTGTMAAAHGGFTTIFPMPNLNPAPDSSENLRLQEEIIERDAVIDVRPLGTITKEQLGKGDLIDFESIKDRVSAFSDDGRGVQSDELMEEAMRRCAKINKAIVAHCEVDELVKMGYIHDGEYCAKNGHRGICSASEYLQVERDIKLAEKTSCQYHVCHVSTKESVEFIRQAKAKGLRVSGETAPHYLLLTDMEIEEDGRFKMNPPIRSKADQEALIKGILDGTIECIATDHAPHSKEEKSKGLRLSMMGIVGLETAFPLMYRYFVANKIMTLEHLIDLMSNNPRRLFDIDGGIAVCKEANFAVWDLNAVYKVNPDDFLSMGKATPFTDWAVQGKCVATVYKGKQVYRDNTYSI